MRGRSFLRLAACIATLVACSASGAGAVPAGWQPPTTIAPAASGVTFGSPLVALNRRGDALAAWSSSPGTGALGERNDGGPWTKPRPLRAPAHVVALNDRGDGLVAWVDGTPDARRVAVSFRRAGGGWRRRLLAPRVGDGSLIITGGLAGDGTAIVIWSSWRRESGDYLVERTSRRANGSWARPIVVATANNPAALETASNGEAVIVWSQACEQVVAAECPRFGSVVRAASHPAGRGWTRSQTLTDPAEESRAPTATVNASGTVLVAWQSYRFTPGERPMRGIKAAVGSTRGRFGRPQKLFDDNAEDTLGVVLAPTGEGLVVWSAFDGVSDEDVFAARRRPHGGFGLPMRIGHGFEPALGMDDRGWAVVAWTRPSATGLPGTSDLFVRAARRAPGRAFGQGVDLAAGGRDCTHHRGCDTDVAVAVNGRGDAVALWRAHTGAGLPGETSLQTAEYVSSRGR